MMDFLEKMEAVEAIRRTKAQYCRYLDTKNWDALGALFADTFVLDVQEDAHVPPVHGRDAAIEQIKEAVLQAATAHQIHQPEIDFEDRDTAHAITPMQDRVVWPQGLSPLPGVESLTGYGQYHETYVRKDGKWLIAHLKLTRFHVDMYPAPVSG